MGNRINCNYRDCLACRQCLADRGTGIGDVNSHLVLSFAYKGKIIRIWIW